MLNVGNIKISSMGILNETCAIKHERSNGWIDVKLKEVSLLNWEESWRKYLNWRAWSFFASAAIIIELKSLRNPAWLKKFTKFLIKFLMNVEVFMSSERSHNKVRQAKFPLTFPMSDHIKSPPIVNFHRLFYCHSSWLHTKSFTIMNGNKVLSVQFCLR